MEQLYQPTYYYKQLTSPGYSNAKDMSREEFNAKFKRIDSDTANYKSSGTNSWNRAYSAKHKLKNNDGSYISFNNSALTYEDAWRQFLSYATNSRDYTLSPKNSDASYVWGTKGNTIVLIQINLKIIVLLILKNLRIRRLALEKQAHISIYIV